MNTRVAEELLRQDEPFTDYQHNLKARFNTSAETTAMHAGARVGVSRPH